MLISPIYIIARFSGYTLNSCRADIDKLYDLAKSWRRQKVLRRVPSLSKLPCEKCIDK